MIELLTGIMIGVPVVAAAVFYVLWQSESKDYQRLHSFTSGEITALRNKYLEKKKELKELRAKNDDLEAAYWELIAADDNLDYEHEDMFAEKDWDDDWEGEE